MVFFMVPCSTFSALKKPTYLTMTTSCGTETHTGDHIQVVLRPPFHLKVSHK